jgi:hypothetical protein
MFATIVGRLPAPPDIDPGDDEAVLRRQLQTQLDAGIELLSFAPPGRSDERVAEAWQRASAAAADLGRGEVKAALTGPFTLGAGHPDTQVVDLARAAIEALVAAGCAFVEIHEPAAAGIGADRAAAARFRAVHERLVAGIDGHLCLAITGGNADEAGPDAILVPGYRSFLLDLILGPDNWRLVAEAPPSVGIVAGAVDHRPGVREVPETGVWAAHYAASTGGRGIDRVGLSSSGSLESLGWDAALARLRVIGEAARIAALPRGEGLARALDPRAVDIRSAAVGRYEPLRRNRPRPGRMGAGPDAGTDDGGR